MNTRITRTELLNFIDQEPNLVLVEALPPTYFAKEHLPGAINLPLQELTAKAAELFQISMRRLWCTVPTRVATIHRLLEICCGSWDTATFMNTRAESRIGAMQVCCLKGRANMFNTSSSAGYGVLLLRLSLGCMWVSHAWLKWSLFTIPGFASWLGAQGISPAFAWPVFLMEVVGGVCILFGFYARVVSLCLLPLLAVAVWVHSPNGWVHTSPGGGWEYPAFLTVSSLCLALLGSGPWSLGSIRKLR